ncbi:autotransporter assembly complex family protein [Thiomicrospira sp. ALE5]|uniref:autotransporter assembly complex protein TamA n=1 Tax=Thiomicrospira sp. ALE5 TaxID=748650 RepID=UPI001F324378|nr:BamA/TamA family outer membrane protein [Thiomicrospira sp. ALE5]
MIAFWCIACSFLVSQPAVAHPELEVQIRFTDAPNADIERRLLQELRLNLLSHDQFPAQTDFLFNRTENEILQILRGLGYYQATVASQLNRFEGRTRARFTLTLGEPVRIKDYQLRIRGEGRRLNVWREYRQFNQRLTEGEIFRHDHYINTLSDLRTLAHNNGFLDAQFTQREFRVNPHTGEVFINIELNTGEAYQFGQVRFTGSEQLHPRFMQSYVEFEPGQQFEQAPLTELQTQLVSSQYFGMVRINPDFDRIVDRRIPIDIEVEDNLKHRYTVGLGYGTDTGARLTLGFQNRLLNRWGHNYEFESVVGQQSQNATFRYRLPGKRPALQYWNVNLGVDATQSSALKRNRTLISPEYVFQVTPKFRFNPFVSLETESFNYANQDTEVIQSLLGGVNLQYRWVNQEGYVNSGYRHSASFRVSSDQFLSNADFQQVELGSRGIYSPLPFLRLHGRIQAAYTFSDDLRKIPATYRYLLGGETLRGYGFETIGIRTERGLEGGANMVQGSVEADYRFSRWLGSGIFVDAGQVYEDVPKDQYLVGAGFGVRGFTPIGTAKLDIAWPLTEPERGYRIHFSLGLDL